MSETLYKWLGENGRPCNGGTGVWPLPKNGKPGAWLSVKGGLVPCQNGIHLCRESDLIHWSGPGLYTAQIGRGKRIDCAKKVVVRRARLLKQCDKWNERTAQLFAADCAEMVLHLFERERPDDDRPRKAIEAARDFAYGEIDLIALDGAARAAWEAAGAAAEAARAAGAAWAAGPARAAGAAAAARAAGAAAEAAEAAGAALAARAALAAWAARAAAGPERAAGAAQTKRLLLYIERGEAAAHEPLEHL